MCGPSNDDSSNDNQSEQVAASGGSGMSPGESQAKFGTTDMAGKKPDVSNYSDMSKDDYVADSLAYQGYTDNYKGVTDGKGNAVTDGKGNAVRSGSYVNAMNQADATYDSYQEYQAERAKAQEAF